MTDDYPFAGSYEDRHGKRRWRFRRDGKTISLPESPGHPEFEVAYAAAIAGLPPPKRKAATVRRLPTAAAPKSFRAAWNILRTADEGWAALGDGIKTAQTRIAEKLLEMPIPDTDLKFGDCAVSDLRRRHVKAILASKSDTPHAAGHVLRVIRKLIGVALDQEWIENDPTYRLKYRPKLKGHKPWPDYIRAAFEARWPIGTMPRTVYSLALYFGHRRSDVATVRWSDLDEIGAEFTQQKTGVELWLPILEQLHAALQAVNKRGEYVLMTAYGKPFSVKGLTTRMRQWTHAADIPKGYTIHGLRKTLGTLLAENGATANQIMAILGHSTLEQAELYTRGAEQKRLAAAGMATIANLPAPKRRTSGEPGG